MTATPDQKPRPGPAPRWAVTKDRDAVRLLAWGDVGPEEVAQLQERLDDLTPGRLPLVVDLTGVRLLHPEAVEWLGRRHAEYGPGRPMLVVVIADGHLHQQLTADGAPQLRLTLE